MRTQVRESGQTAVETALTLPMLTFFILGVIQLGMMHQAQLMTEYAAYRAVRAGIVNGADCTTMADSAFLSLLPTLPAPRISVLSGGKSRVDTLLSAAALFKDYKLPGNRTYITGMPMVRTEIVNPRRGEIPTLFSKYGGHLDGKEIDYDDNRDERVVRANLLTVRVTYNYRLRIPFADWMIHSWFMGAQRLRDIQGIQFEAQTVGGGIGAYNYLETAGAARGSKFAQLRALSLLNVHVIPLVATYSMRMQSNLLKGGMTSCAVD